MYNIIIASGLALSALVCVPMAILSGSRNEVILISLFNFTSIFLWKLVS